MTPPETKAMLDELRKQHGNLADFATAQVSLGRAEDDEGNVVEEDWILTISNPLFRFQIRLKEHMFPTLGHIFNQAAKDSVNKTLKEHYCGNPECLGYSPTSETKGNA